MEPSQDNSVTDLLALRLSSVPFHDIEQNQAIANQPSTSSQSTHRWVPQVTTISFVGPLHPVPTRPAFFKSKVPLVTDSSPSHHSACFSLVALPNAVVVGELPDSSLSFEPTWNSNWLISGELCVMSGEFIIVAQSLYRLDDTNNHQITSQISFTGYISSIVPAKHVTWIWSNVKTSGTTIEDAMKVASEPEPWHSAEICSQVQVSLADLEWLDVSTEVGEKSPQDLIGWVQGGRELISFKCRPSKTKQDHTRMIEYATTVPLVGQLIAIELADVDRMNTFFIQL